MNLEKSDLLKKDQCHLQYQIIILKYLMFFIFIAGKNVLNKVHPLLTHFGLGLDYIDPFL